MSGAGPAVRPRGGHEGAGGDSARYLRGLLPGRLPAFGHGAGAADRRVPPPPAVRAVAGDGEPSGGSGGCRRCRSCRCGRRCCGWRRGRSGTVQVAEVPDPGVPSGLRAVPVGGGGGRRASRRGRSRRRRCWRREEVERVAPVERSGVAGGNGHGRPGWNRAGAVPGTGAPGEAAAAEGESTIRPTRTQDSWPAHRWR